MIHAYGYVPNAVQTKHALLGIRLGASICPVVAIILGLVYLAIYPISKKFSLRIQDELAERRNQYAAQNAIGYTAKP